jgi:hypothetical protein
MPVKKATCAARRYAAFVCTFPDGPSLSEAGKPMVGDFEASTTESLTATAVAYLEMFPQDLESFEHEVRRDKHTTTRQLGAMLFTIASEDKAINREGASKLLSKRCIELADHNSLFFEHCTGCQQLCESCDGDAKVVLAAFRPKPKNKGGRPPKRQRSESTRTGIYGPIYASCLLSAICVSRKSYVCARVDSIYKMTLRCILVADDK